MYSRFKALQKFNEEDLEEIENSRVAVVGLGATGSVIAENLARHGVNLVLIDRDYLEPNDVYSSNIYTPNQCENAVPKAEAAKTYLENFTEARSQVRSLGPDNTGILDDAELIVDGTDNLETRFLIDEYSQKNGTPWIYTAAVGEKAYSMFFDDKCFSCIFEDVGLDVAETCESAGILREIAGRAALQTSEKAVNYLAGNAVAEKLDVVHEGRSLDVESEGCEVCEGEGTYLDKNPGTTSVCGENKYQVDKDFNQKAVKNLKETGEVLAENSYLVRVKTDGRKITVFNDGRIILEARDKGHAEALVSEKLGI